MTPYESRWEISTANSTASSVVPTMIARLRKAPARHCRRRSLRPISTPNITASVSTASCRTSTSPETSQSPDALSMIRAKPVPIVTEASTRGTYLVRSGTMRIRKSPRSINTTRLMAAERAKKVENWAFVSSHVITTAASTRQHTAPRSTTARNAGDRISCQIGRRGCSITNSVGVFASEVSRAVTRCPSATRNGSNSGLAPQQHSAPTCC